MQSHYFQLVHTIILRKQLSIRTEIHIKFLHTAGTKPMSRTYQVLAKWNLFISYCWQPMVHHPEYHHAVKCLAGGTLLSRVNNRRGEYPTQYRASTNDSARFKGLPPDVLTCSHLQNKEMWWLHLGGWWLKQSSHQ